MSDDPGTLAMSANRPLLVAAVVVNVALVVLALLSLREKGRWVFVAFAALLALLVVIAVVALLRRGAPWERWFAPVTAVIWLIIAAVAG